MDEVELQTDKNYQGRNQVNIAYFLADRVHPEGTSGAAAHVRHVTRALQNRGHEIAMIRHALPAPSSSDTEAPARPDRPTWRRRVLQLLPARLRRGLRNVRTRLQNERLMYRHRQAIADADVIYERDTPQSFLIGTIAAHHGVPWVIECNGLFWGENQSTFHQPALPALYKRRHVQKWKKADHIIVVSGQLKQRLIRHGVPAVNISVIHNGVDIEPHTTVTEEDRAAMRNTLGLGDAITIGFIGHMLPKHNVKFIIEAVGRLSDKYPVRALIVGGGRWTTYKQKACEAGLQRHVVFTGPVSPDKVPLYTSVMDICTLPGCHHTDSPVKLFDYGAAGKSVVAPDMPNIREIIEDGSEGLLFQPGDRGAFVEQIRKLLDHSGLRRRLGKELKNKVEDNYTWKRVGARTEAILHAVR